MDESMESIHTDDEMEYLADSAPDVRTEVSVVTEESESEHPAVPPGSLHRPRSRSDLERLLSSRPAEISERRRARRIVLGMFRRVDRQTVNSNYVNRPRPYNSDRNNTQMANVEWLIRDSPPRQPAMGVFPRTPPALGAPQETSGDDTTSSTTRIDSLIAFRHIVPPEIWLAITERLENRVVVETQMTESQLTRWMARLDGQQCPNPRCLWCVPQRSAWRLAFYRGTVFRFNIDSFERRSLRTSIEDRLQSWLLALGENVKEVRRLHFRHPLFNVIAEFCVIDRRLKLDLVLKGSISTTTGCHLRGKECQELFENIARQMLANTKAAFEAEASNSIYGCHIERLVKDVCKILIMHNMIWCEVLTPEDGRAQHAGFVPTDAEMQAFGAGTETNLEEYYRVPWISS